MQSMHEPSTDLSDDYPDGGKIRQLLVDLVSSPNYGVNWTTADHNEDTGTIRIEVELYPLGAQCNES